MPTYQILGSRKVPNYRKFLKGEANKANLSNFLSTYILENAAEHIPYGKSITLAGGFSVGNLVKVVSTSGYP